MSGNLVSKITRLLNVPKQNRGLIYRFYGSIGNSPDFGALWMNKVIQHLISCLQLIPDQDPVACTFGPFKWPQQRQRYLAIAKSQDKLNQFIGALKAVVNTIGKNNQVGNGAINFFPSATKLSVLNIKLAGDMIMSSILKKAPSIKFTGQAIEFSILGLTMCARYARSLLLMRHHFDSDASNEKKYQVKKIVGRQFEDGFARIVLVQTTINLSKQVYTFSAAQLLNFYNFYSAVLTQQAQISSI